jgi:hypothetical protein
MRGTNGESERTQRTRPLAETIVRAAGAVLLILAVLVFALAVLIGLRIRGCGSNRLSEPPVADTERSHRQAMKSLGELAAANPEQERFKVVTSVSSHVGPTVLDIQHWAFHTEYDREAGRFTCRQEDSLGPTIEYRYSEVTDDMLIDLGKRAADEMVDHFDLQGYGCPCEVLRNGKVVLPGPQRGRGRARD